jgi:hypothetical protein
MGMGITVDYRWEGKRRGMNERERGRRGGSAHPEMSDLPP